MQSIVSSDGRERRKRPRLPGWRAGLSSLLLLSAVGLGPARAENGEWEFTVTPYLWLAFVNAEVDTSQGGTVDTSANFNDIFTDLNFAFMLSGEAHNGEFGALVDLLYVDVTTEGDTPRGFLWDKAVVDTSGFVASLYGEYRVVSTDTLHLDLLAGMRVYTVSVDTELKGGVLAKRHDDLNETWVDPVVGLRGRLMLGENWFIGASGDVGGFDVGSKLTWQALGTVGWQFADNWTAVAGYRYLFVNKEIDGQDVKLGLHGPLVGVTYKF
jgi:outer membrane receptor protein involved in Fe transport